MENTIRIGHYYKRKSEERINNLYILNGEYKEIPQKEKLYSLKKIGGGEILVQEKTLIEDFYLYNP